MIELVLAGGGLVLLGLATQKPKPAALVRPVAIDIAKATTPAQIVARLSQRQPAGTSTLLSAVEQIFNPLPPSPVPNVVNASGDKGRIKLGSTPTAIGPLTLQLARGDVGIWVEGSGHTISGIRFRNGLQGILVNGATSNITINDYGCVNPWAGYGIYIAKGGKSAPNDRTTVNGFDIRIEKEASGVAENGQHNIRIYAATNLTLTRGTLLHEGYYLGTSIDLKQASNFDFSGITTIGRPWGFGANTTMSEVNYFVENGLVRDCNFDMYGAQSLFAFGSGCRNIHFKGETKRAKYNMRDRQPILQGRSAWQTRPAAQNIVFENYDFTGGSDLIQGGTPANVFGFINSTYNGRAI